MHDLLMEKYESDSHVLEIHIDDIPIDPREWDNLGTIVTRHSRYTLGDKHHHNYRGSMYDMLIDELCNEFGVYKEEMDEEKIEDLLDRTVYLPVSMYEHSNIHLSIGSRNQIGWIYCTKERANEWTGYTSKELYLGCPDREPDVGEHVKTQYFSDRWGKVINKNGEGYFIDFDYHKITNARDEENKVYVSGESITEVMSNKAEEMLKGELDTYDNYVSGSVYRFKFKEKERCDCCNNVEEIIVDSCGGFYGYPLEENGMLYQLPQKAVDLYHNKNAS